MIKRNTELTSGGYFFRYQFVNKLSWTLMVRHCFGHEVIYSNVGKPHKAQFPLAKPVAAVWTESNFIVGNKFVKRVRFFFGHSCHKEGIA